MEKQNISLFTRLKLYYNKKPVRVIIALIIIAGIMTGVAFGIMALIKALSDPCAQQPGKTWNKELKRCVFESCKINGEKGKVCTAPNKVNECIPNNYCDYSDIEGQYSYDEDTCMCKLLCSGDEQGFTKDGLNEVDMRKTNTGFQPKNLLYCGNKCQFSSKQKQNIHGGEGWCAPKYLCGQEILENGENIAPGMCFDPNNNMGRCGDSDIICPLSGSVPECVSTNEGPRCKIKFCGTSGDKNDKTTRVPCITNKDCSKDGISTKFECDHSSKELTLKNFQNVGICKNTDIRYTDTQRCVNYEKIGEDIYGNAIDCGNKIGISNRLEQCEGAMDEGNGVFIYNNSDKNYKLKACARKLCSNNWQVNPGNNGEGLCKKNPTICSINEECNLPQSDCCINNIGDECCNVSIKENPGCLLTTTLPYDASFLKLGSLGEELSNPNNDSLLEEYNEKLRLSLGRASNDENFKLIDGSSIEGGKSGKLYGQCGSKISGKEPNPPFVSNFPLDSSIIETNICVNKSKCQNTPSQWIQNKVGNIPICKYDTGNKLYWSQKNSSEGNRATLRVGFTGSACENPTNNINNILLDQSGVDSWKFLPGKEGSYDYIDFGVDCNKLELIVPDKGTVAWNDLQDPKTWNNNNYNFLTNSDLPSADHKYITTTGDILNESGEIDFTAQKCPSDWYKIFDCANNKDDSRCSDCSTYSTPEGDSYYCPGNKNSFPELMVRSPRKIGYHDTTTGKYYCDGPSNALKNNKLVSPDGEYCKIGYSGNCQN